MTPVAWEKVREVFAAAAEMDRSARSSYLDTCCSNDPEVRSEVERLLAQHDASGGLLGDDDDLEWVLAQPNPQAVLVGGEVLCERFRIVRYVGRGGMGEVYEAEDLDLGGRVALKTLRAELVSDYSSLRRFRREIQLARQVAHPNVCKVYDVGRHCRDDGVELAFLTMEFLEGETLADYLKRKGRLTPEKALPIIRQMAEGLQALHDKSIIHRDFKPGNVMLAEGEEGEARIVIMDFGLARYVTSGDLPRSEETASGLVLGTLDYMAPEQRAGDIVGPRADVYSFGLTVQALLRPTQEDGLSGRTDDGPHSTQPEQALVEIVRTCTAHLPRDRFPHGRELCEGIERALSATHSRIGPAASLAATEKPAAFQAPDREAARALNPNRLLLAAAGVALSALGVLGASVNVDKAREQLCGIFVGSPWFCNLPADKDLAVTPIELKIEGNASPALGRGLVRYLSDNLYRFYPEREHFCLHFREPEEIYSEKLVLTSSLHVDDSRAEFRGELRDAATGQVLRLLTQSFELGDLAGLSEGLIAGIVEMTDQVISEEDRARWRGWNARDPDAFLAFLTGLGHFHTPGSDPSRLENAERSFREATKGDSGGLAFAAASVGLGDVYREQFGSTKSALWATRAERAYRQAQSAPHYAPLHAGWGRLDLLRGRTEEAIQRLHKAVDLEPFDFENRLALAAALRSANQSDEADRIELSGAMLQPECWYRSNRLAEHALHLGRYEDSERELLRVIELSPRNGAAYANLARVYLKLGRYEEAIENAAKAVSIDRHPQDYSTLGQAYVYLGCAEQGFVNLRHAVSAATSKRYVYLMNLGEALRHAGYWLDESNAAIEEARFGAQEVLQREPSDPVALRILARSAAWLGNRKQAFEALERLEQLDPKNRVALFTAAVVNALAGRRDEAAKKIQDSLRGGLSVFEIRQSPALSGMLPRKESLEALAAIRSEDPQTDVQAPCPDLLRPGLPLIRDSPELNGMSQASGPSAEPSSRIDSEERKPTKG